MRERTVTTAGDLVIQWRQVPPGGTILIAGPDPQHTVKQFLVRNLDEAVADVQELADGRLRLTKDEAEE